MAKNKFIEVPKKPVAPVIPEPREFRYQPVDNYVNAYRNYLSKQEKYERDLEIYQQTKMIKLIKSADIKLILRKFKIEKR